MKTTYITLKPEMARAFREGRKSMTRRVIKWPKWIKKEDDESIMRIVEIINTNKHKGVVKRGYCDGIVGKYTCPYGQVGDQLIFGATWAVPKMYDDMKPTELSSGFGIGPDFNPIPIWSYFESDEKPEHFGKLRPARFLPGFLRHRMPTVTLKIVRAERVQEITDEEAIREGIREVTKWQDMPKNDVSTFMLLWDSINEKRGYGWESNPYVWVLGW